MISKVLCRTGALMICIVGVLTISTSSAQAADESPGVKAQAASAPAPAKFNVKVETTKGNFEIEVNREWAPNGADRFHELVKTGFYDQAGFFRVVPGFVVQFGLHADPQVQQKWTNAKIKDDPVVESNKRGYLTFAMAGPNTRTSQLFISYADNARLDNLGFAPFGRVVKGMEIVEPTKGAEKS